ncbi:MAG: cation-translocating P-type ATPase [Lachnospiraceae bacterium]|nr:cation-translocating P-type ATPase [Lachnospiraceae bacterium]
MLTFYQQTADEVKRQVNGHIAPLSAEEVKEHQEKYGANELVEGKKKHPIQIFLEQFLDFLVLILIAAATISGFMGDAHSAIVIVIVITINAVLGTVQTLKAEASLNSLKKLAGPEAKVLRAGNMTPIPASEVTVGDIVLLEAGDCVPADGRIVTCASMKVDESAMTGESLAVEKMTEVIAEEVPLGDRVNMLFSGSFVTYGRGTFVVTGIGMDTEVGKIAGLLKSTSEKRTPLQISLDQFGKRLSIIIIVFCAILFGINMFRYGVGNFADAFIFAVALAVAAIPEALSSIVTIVLAFGTQKMARENAIIRKLQAVEGLGSVSIICSDKTGTLTQNKMTVEDYYINEQRISASDVDIHNKTHYKLVLASILCNDSTHVNEVEMGDPTETALIHLPMKMGMDVIAARETFPRESEVPFDSDRKRMSTMHTIDGERIAIVKGAFDVLLDRIDNIWTEIGVRPIRAEDYKKIEEINLAFSKDGLRVLGFAYKKVSKDKGLSIEDERNLTFLGLISMMDPPREESRDAVAECKRAGIRPIMITGDHKITAAAIARRIGILEDEAEACEGAVIESMCDTELKEFVPKISVYARVSPEHKIRIVRAWQERQNIVAMTGDGVNDAPALKQANIGVAMGITGSEVSKDAAAMVLTDDNFATIVKAVENGRNLYRNIKNAIQFLLSGNFAAIVTVLFASIAGLPVPFAAIHLLFINLLTDSLPAIALGMEPHSSDVMEEKPRPMHESIMTGDFLRSIALEGFVIAVMTVVAFLIGLQGDRLLGMTMAFGTLCISRLLHGYNAKSKKPILFTSRFFNNPFVTGAFLLGVVLVTAVLMIPMLANIFTVQTLTVNQLLYVYLLSLANLPIIQFLKWIRIKIVNCRQ